jgi:carboxypeptidase T
MAFYHVAIQGRDRRHLAELGPKHRIVVVGFREDKSGAIVDAYVSPEKAEWLSRHGYGVTRLENVEVGDRKRQAEGRKSLAGRIHRGRYGDVIWGGGYLTADEVEQAMVLGERNHPGTFERIRLPYKTWEGRVCHVGRIGRGPRGKKTAVCFLGGVHGREWGSSDILVYFAMRLLRAYRGGGALRFGRKAFSAARVREIVETVDIFLFPQVNPDGRNFSMERHPMWRKNRRPAPRGRAHGSIGVDLNRNFPFLWHVERHFAPGTVDSSRKPGDYESYMGPRPASEPETRNVIWLLDQNPRIRYLIDLHSYGETILYNWGVDANQSEDPGMSFRNPAYDGRRGRIYDHVYREYMPAPDQETVIHLAKATASAIRSVRGRKYTVRQSVGLYPTTASTDDYAYSRHWVDPRKGKVLAYTMEWGRSHSSTPFHPPYPEMRKVMREVAAGLAAFCLSADSDRGSGTAAGRRRKRSLPDSRRHS